MTIQEFDITQPVTPSPPQEPVSQNANRYVPPNQLHIITPDKVVQREGPRSEKSEEEVRSCQSEPELQHFEFRNIEGDVIRPAEFKAIPTVFIRVKPGYDSDLEKRDDVIMISVLHGEEQLDVWMNCATIPEDGEAIADKIWEHLEPPDDWKLCLMNGSIRPDDYCTEHHERFQVRLASDFEPKCRNIRFQGHSFAIPEGEDPIQFLKLPGEDLYVSGSEIVARGNGGEQPWSKTWAIGKYARYFYLSIGRHDRFCHKPKRRHNAFPVCLELLGYEFEIFAVGSHFAEDI